MRFPIDVSKLSIIVIGDPSPVMVYGTDTPRLTSDGKPLYKIPVLLTGTGEKIEPTTTITVTGTPPPLPRGSVVQFSGLTLSTWSMRDQNGRERSGVTLKADAVRTESKTALK